MTRSRCRAQRRDTGDDPSVAMHWRRSRRRAQCCDTGDDPGVALSVATPVMIQASRSMSRHTGDDPKHRR
nr:hypothetical protein CFP56_52721 [Quercus suber]